MLATDVKSLTIAASPYQAISTEILALQAQIYLLQAIAANTQTARQLITAASGLQVISDPTTARQVIIYLLGLISNEV